ncbi:MAG: class I SAM-dependent methyltransferase [Gaiellaceae bacterium]
MTQLPRPVRRGALPLDTYERHALVARLAAGPERVLDVGGTPGVLALFLGSSITSVNVEPPADVLIDGVTLPFPDSSFDAVTSIDVLEHLPREARTAHVAELARVASRRVVLCCPLGTDRHVAAERALGEWIERETGAQRRFGAEHLLHGLPTEAELRSLAAAAPGAFELRFHGDFRRVESLFRAGVRARRSRAALARYALRRLRTRPDLALASEATDFTNRAFLIGMP